MALQDTDVTVPRTLAVHPVHEAMLSERVPGETWFYRIKDADEQVRVAQDFIRNLAALHRLDPLDLALPSFGPVKTVPEHVRDEIANMRRRATRADGSIDSLVRLSLDWLERNVPAYEEPVVFVQGDTGPGNFMYENGHVTAVVDWELSHFGDPMDDIAWLSLRTVQDTFTHFPDRLREYEDLSGNTIDAARVWYYRLFAETRLVVELGRRRREQHETEGRATGGARRRERPHLRDAAPPAHDRSARERDGPRARVRSSCRASRLREPWHALYDSTLDNLQVIVPRIDDPLASQWTKGVARVLKYLKEIDRSGRAFDDAERDDLTRLLGTEPATVADGRRALERATSEGAVRDEDYVAFLWRQVQRDDHLMRTASGALHDRTWPPLTDAGAG